MMTRARWTLAGAAVLLLLVLAWGWVQRNGRLRAEGELAAAHRATATAVAHADSVEAIREADKAKHAADSVRFAQERDAALVMASNAGRARREAETRANAAAQAVEDATRGVRTAAGDSTEVVKRLDVLVQAHSREVGELRSALQSETERSTALERALAVTDSTVASLRVQLAQTEAARVAERDAKEAALAEVAAHEAARPGFFEKALHYVLPPLAFVAGVWVGAQAGG